MEVAGSAPPTLILWKGGKKGLPAKSVDHLSREEGVRRG